MRNRFPFDKIIFHASAWLIAILIVMSALGMGCNHWVNIQTALAESENSTVPHRQGMYGVSDVDIDSIEVSFSVSNVNNDVTGNWRISTISADVDIEKYALSYYKKYFKSDSEIHGIVNYADETTTKISCMMSYLLDVSIYKHIDGEEQDAKALFSGELLEEYFVYLDNGNIESIL